MSSVMEQFGYVQCVTCHGEFHKSDVRENGKCRLCDSKEGPKEGPSIENARTPA